MYKQETSRNAFLALCDLASKENWCWKIPCTTCGGMYFRKSFLELVEGKSPDDPDWSIRNANHHCIRSIPRSYSTRQQRVLAEIVSNARLSEIAKQSKFPDWLGYLGLVLHFCEENEVKNRTLTKSLIPQFLDLISRHESSPAIFTTKVNGKRMLSWTDLKRVERALSSDRHHYPKRRGL